MLNANVKLLRNECKASVSGVPHTKTEERSNLYRLTDHELRARYHFRERNHRLLRERPFSFF